jgi:glycogen operon protein
MTRRDWESAAPLLGVFLNGAELGALTPQGERVVDDSFLILFNAHHDYAVFTLPPRRFGAHWIVEVTSSTGVEEGDRHAARAEVRLESRSLVVLRRG